MNKRSVLTSKHDDEMGGKFCENNKSKWAFYRHKLGLLLKCKLLIDIALMHMFQNKLQ